MASLDSNPHDWVQLSLDDFRSQADCPACGSSKRSPIGGYGKNLIFGRTFAAGSFRFPDQLRQVRELLKCENCQLIYQEWIPSPELLLKLYATADTAQPWVPEARRLTWKRVLERLPQEPRRLLDVGANDGHFLSLVPRKWQRAALEPTDAVNATLRNVADEVYRGFMDDPISHLPPNSFDVVCLFDVAEHFRDVKLAMANLANCLRPGGKVFIETGNTGCAPARLLKSLWWYYDYIEHFVFFNRTSLAQALETANLKMTYFQPVIHTDRGKFPKMYWQLAKQTSRAWQLQSELRLGTDSEQVYLQHPLRVYWRDHLFAVACKEAI